jgi:hypothetical protein
MGRTIRKGVTMNRNEGVQEQVEKTLAELDSLRRINADHFFYTRLKARIMAKGGKRRGVAGAYSRRWVLGAAGIVLLIALNVYSVIRVSMERADAESLKQEHLQSFADEYDLRYTMY